MVKGAAAGVLVLAGVVYAVVLSMGGVMVFWCLRARRLQAAGRGADGPPER